MRAFTISLITFMLSAVVATTAAPVSNSALDVRSGSRIALTRQHQSTGCVGACQLGLRASTGPEEGNIVVSETTQNKRKAEPLLKMGLPGKVPLPKAGLPGKVPLPKKTSTKVKSSTKTVASTKMVSRKGSTSTLRATGTLAGKKTQQAANTATKSKGHSADGSVSTFTAALAQQSASLQSELWATTQISLGWSDL